MHITGTDGEITKYFSECLYSPLAVHTGTCTCTYMYMYMYMYIAQERSDYNIIKYTEEHILPNRSSCSCNILCSKVRCMYVLYMYIHVETIDYPLSAVECTCNYCCK